MTAKLLPPGVPLSKRLFDLILTFMRHGLGFHTDLLS